MLDNIKNKATELLHKTKDFFKNANKKLLIIIATSLCLTIAFIGTTVAYLTAVSGPVENSFVIGNIKLELTETTGNTYQLIPGKTVEKNPKVIVKSGSEDCWVFVKVEKTSGFDNYLEYEIEDGWTHLGGFDGVYYRTVVNAKTDVEFNVLKSNAITVRDDLTEEKMSAITSLPTMTFSAYAVQSHTVDDVVDAWIIVLGEVNE